MKKKKEVITGFITRTRRSKKAVLSLSLLRTAGWFNSLFTDYIINKGYNSLEIEYSEKEVFLNFKKDLKGSYKLYKQKNDNHICFSASSLRKYLLKDIYEGKGIAHYAIYKTSEKDCFALKVMTSDFE